MSFYEPDEQSVIPKSITDRYLVEQRLGRGGMAVVYCVFDTSANTRLALKKMQLRDDEEARAEHAEFFEREYNTLVHLAHPRIVEVYDYGLDKTGPYYTMELLNSSDLHELSPLPWQKACSVLCDICSALSLLHSRRLIHRDLTPRNIRFTPDGHAKLLDFGAMVPMGPCKQLIGTPPFTPPEAVNFQSLDARADLYSLGATAYYALTCHHAYPARNFAALRDAWRSGVRPLSSFVRDIPKAFESLVISLINLDPIARPVSAAEVMERLSAIADFEIDEQLLVSQAYLSTPTLVGREGPSLRVRKQVIRALRGRGGVMMIQGDSGVGRSRLLDVCVLEGKLAGVTVLRSDASDAHPGDYGVVRALAAQLLDLLPEQALKAAMPHKRVLGHVLPELFEAEAAPSTSQGYSSSSPPWKGVWGRGYSSVPPPFKTRSEKNLKTFGDQRLLRPQVQAALREWLLDVTRNRALMIAVDDVHRIDEPSAAMLALLANEADKNRLMVVVTYETDANTTSVGALKLFSEAGARVELRNLGTEHTQKLLGSVFGEVPNLQLVADRLYTLSQGNPRTIMQLAQYLVDKGMVRYRTGAWFLPASLDAGDLPGGFIEALEAQLATLGQDVYRLAETMALSTVQSFSLSECRVLFGQDDPSRLHRALDELVTAQVLSTDGHIYAFGRQQGWVTAFIKNLEEKRKGVIHLRLAEMFEQRDREEFRVGRHLMLAGEEERGVDLLIAYCERASEQLGTGASELIQSLPSDWADTFESALGACQRLGRPRRQSRLLRRTFVFMSTITGIDCKTHLIQQLEELYWESGLGIYHELSDSLEPPARLKRALDLAQQRYDKSSETERGLSPLEAIIQLAQTVAEASGKSAGEVDDPFWQTLPSLKPLLPLSPALEIVEMLVQSVGNINVGRTEQYRRGAKEILKRISESDHGGLAEEHYQYIRLGMMYGLGLVEAAMGLKTSLALADQLDTDLLHQVNAWRIRLMYHLCQGNAEQVQQCRKRAELLQVQNSPTQHLEGMNLFPNVFAYALTDDLIGIRQTIHLVEKMADRYQGWVPVLYFAQGEYQRIRGDYRSALSEYEKALKLIAPGRHCVWVFAAGSHLKTLFELGRFQEIKELGQELLIASEAENVGYHESLIKMPLALAEAKLGDCEGAIMRSEAVIDNFRSLGTTGINLGLAYETRTRIAVFMQDRESFLTYTKLCAEVYRSGGNPTLIAKHEKLTQEARQAGLGVSMAPEGASGLYLRDVQTAESFFSSHLALCRGARERAERSLALLIEQSKAGGGYLYTMQKGGPMLAAQEGNRATSAEIDEMVRAYLSAELEEANDVTMTSADLEVSAASDSEWTTKRGGEYYPLLLANQRQEGLVITGIALLRKDPEKVLNIPYEAAAALSHALLEAGDVAIFYAAERAAVAAPAKR